MPVHDATVEPLGSSLMAFDEEGDDLVPDEDKYWFERSDEALVTALQQKEQEWFDYALNHGYIDVWLQMLAEYYGKDPTTFSGFDAAAVEFEGDDGELVRFRVNEMRSYIRQFVARTTKERPAFKAGTLNTNFAAGAQVEILDGLSNHLYESHVGEVRERRLVERGELFAKMWGWIRWDATGGEMSDVPVMIPAGTQLPTGQVLEEDTPMGEGITEQVRAGMPLVRIMSPWDVIEDPTVDDEEDHRWRVVRERRSKWDLMARYPDKRDQIRGSSITTETAWELTMAFDDSILSDDDVLVKHAYHPPSEEHPEGSYVLICGEHVLDRMAWAEADIPREEIPVVQYAPAEMVGSSFCYSDRWDQLVVQQMITQITSDVATNISALGRQFLMLPQGSEITPEQLANGMFAAYVPADEIGKIAAPLLGQVGAGQQWFFGSLQKIMQTMGGENSVSRGDPAENIKSGTMAALFHAIALEHGHIPQACLDRFREKVCMWLIDFIRAYSQGEFLAKLVGEDEAPRLQYFRAEVLEPVKQVFIRTTNPMLRARAGQIELANYLKDVPGAIQTPQQAVQAFTTGQIKPLYRGPEAQLQRIQFENEQLRKPQRILANQVPVMDPMTGMPAFDPMTGQIQMKVERSLPDLPAEMTDNPSNHITEHLVVRNDPTSTKEIRDQVDAHIEEHMRVYRQCPPDLAMMIGFPPAQAPQMPEQIGGGKKEVPESLSAPEGKDSQVVDDSGVGLPQPADPPEGAAV